MKILKSTLKSNLKKGDYVKFNPADYVDNPVALARIKAHLTQKELAERMKVTQSYVNKIESQDKVTAKLIECVNKALIGNNNAG